MATTKNIDWHKRLLEIAKKETEHHVTQDEDGELCFNLHSFLESLESVMIDEIERANGLYGKFALDAENCARYLWCCLAIETEGKTYPDSFRGMPVLD